MTTSVLMASGVEGLASDKLEARDWCFATSQCIRFGVSFRRINMPYIDEEMVEDKST